jgi:hypothetical protein
MIGVARGVSVFAYGEPCDTAREGYATGDDVKLEREIEALLRAQG